jgi:sialic acid synthase SpsE/sugar phosphate isomerase/epimerase
VQKKKVYAEIGINHNGQFTVAQNLIRAAAEAGVAGVKFQYRNLANAYAEGPKQIGDEILFKEITKNYLAPSVIIRLVDFAQGLRVEAGISFFDVSDIADFGVDISRFDFFKVPSVELGNSDLVNTMLQYGKQVYVSLGCQSEIEIEQAFASYIGGNWLAMHCVSNYPVSLANAKLGYLKHMEAKWGGDFGYSSHDENWEVCLIAMAMGACVIERHITFDKQAQGLDHSTSSTPDEFRRIVMFAENMPLILSGDGPRIPNQGEKLNLQNLGRSYYAKEGIEIGQVVTLEKLTLRAPCIGLGRTEMQQYVGKSPAKRIEPGMVLSRSTFEMAPQVSDAALSFARRKRVALPVRLHDQAAIEAKFPIGAYEFHLSFGEVLAGLSAGQYGKHNYYSVHLPDYINSTQLMDPFSFAADQAGASRNILQRTVDFAKSLQDLTGKPVPIVGSFSVIHKDLAQFYEQHAMLISDYEREGVTILPQWLPPIAWYFGGSVKLNAMNQLHDIEMIRKHMLPICMDVCHLCMGDSLYKFGALNVINKLMPNIRHVHIADADGIDGEGLQFGEGAPGNITAIKTTMDIECMKVIEVWQGHLDGGAGFAKALTRLAELFDGE